MNSGVGLGGVYDATLEWIKAQHGEKAKLALATLMWVCHSKRPLQADELCHALAVEVGSANFDPDNVPLIATLLGCCQGLITVDKEASTVRLIHYTLQEYLSAYPHLFATAHSTIAETYLTYLNSQQVRSLPPYPLPDQQSMPFLKYSSQHWGTHAGREFSDRGMSLALELLSRYETHISATSILRQSRGGYDFGDGFGGIGSSSLLSALHCASFFGIVELATALIHKEGCEVNQRDCTGATPLSWAAEKGHEEMVVLLLNQENVASDNPDDQGRTPLWYAILGGHEGVVRVLLEQKDIDPNYRDNEGRTPLQVAAVCKHEGLVKTLLGWKNVDPNCRDTEGRTALSLAAWLGKMGAVNILLEQKDIDPNCQDNKGRTPLLLAATSGQAEVVKIVLEREDIDPNCQDNKGLTPLQFAAFRGEEGLYEMLLDRKICDVMRLKRHILSLASKLGNEGAVKILLEQEDIDPNCQDNKDRTPLLLATVNGIEEVIKIVLGRKDIDPTTQITRAEHR